MNKRKSRNVVIRTKWDRNYHRDSSPGYILTLAVRKGFLTEEEANLPLIQDIAAEEAWTLENWPEDQGFGSSDMNAIIRNILKAAQRKGFRPSLRVSSTALESELIKLGQANKALRPHIRPVLAALKEAGQWSVEQRTITQDLSKIFGNVASGAEDAMREFGVKYFGDQVPTSARQGVQNIAWDVGVSEDNGELVFFEDMGRGHVFAAFKHRNGRYYGGNAYNGNVGEVFDAKSRTEAEAILNEWLPGHSVRLSSTSRKVASRKHIKPVLDSLTSVSYRQAKEDSEFWDVLYSLEHAERLRKPFINDEQRKPFDLRLLNEMERSDHISLIDGPRGLEVTLAPQGDLMIRLRENMPRQA